MATLLGPGSLGMPMFSAEQNFKTENGLRFPRQAFAHAPAGSLPSEWKLRLWETPDKKETPHQIGMAVAALGSGFRGNKVSIPAHDLPSVKRRVLRAWHVANPDSTDVPAVLKTSLDGVAPPGWEHSIKHMKKDGAIDNPWALSWWMKNRGAKPAHASSMDASVDDSRLLQQLKRQQHQAPLACIAAARGEAWAQAQLLASDCPALVIEGRW